MMLGTAQGMGVRIEKPVTLPLTNDRVDQVVAALRNNVTTDTQVSSANCIVRVLDRLHSKESLLCI